jgi:hypothetical protein
MSLMDDVLLMVIYISDFEYTNYVKSAYPLRNFETLPLLVLEIPDVTEVIFSTFVRGSFEYVIYCVSAPSFMGV